MAGVAKLQLLINLRNDLRRGLDVARRQVSQAVGGMQSRLNSFRANITSGLSSIGEQIPMVGSAISMMANPFAVVTTAATLALGAITSCTMAANDWHTQMAEINVTAELSKSKLGNLSDKLLEIGSRNVAPLEEVPKAFNKIISAGLSVNDSLATLEPTLRAAKAGFTDIETTASAATSIMMSAGVDAAKAFDVLFATQKEGNAGFKDIANYLPKVIPLARNVGFALEETAGAYASLTTTLKPESASTALEGMMRAMSDANVVKNFKGLKIDIFDKSTGQARPLLGIIEDVSKSMAGLTDEQRNAKLGKLGLDQSATLAFSTLMQNLPKVTSDIDAVTNSQGALNKAYTDSLTPMDSWKIILNQIKGEMIQIGELFLPMLSAAGEKVLGFIQYWKDLYNESILFRDILTALGWLSGKLFDAFSFGIRPIIQGFSELWNILSPIVAKIKEAISNVTGLKGSFTDMYENVRPYLVFIKDLLTQIGGLMIDIATFDVSGAIDNIKNFKMPEVTFSAKAKSLTQRDSGDFAGVRKLNPDPDVPVSENPINNTNSAIADGVKGIKGGSQTKNITINIDSFVKGGLSNVNQSLNGLSMAEVEKKLTEMFLRVVRSAETM